eukprot:6277-Heterococcus_DN1.PRE.3
MRQTTSLLTLLSHKGRPQHQSAMLICSYNAAAAAQLYTAAEQAMEALFPTAAYCNATVTLLLNTS